MNTNILSLAILSFETFFKNTIILLLMVFGATQDIAGQEFYPQRVQNQAQLTTFFTKLKVLQNTQKGKLNIVHIGDSHIQGDVMTAVTRTQLQKQFGNAGRGLVFPYTLAHTNGSPDVRFSSNVKWSNYKNILPVNGSPVGISGFSLSSTSKSLRLNVMVKNKAYAFTTLKLITPNNEPLFERAGEVEKKVTVKTVPKKVTHTIKKGESLSTIAARYHCSTAQLKKENNLANTKITAGKTLKIPSNETHEKTVTSTLYHSDSFEQKENYYAFASEKPLDRFVILPNKEASVYTLNGLVLENNNSGILYHNIGVNGAKYSDYNKNPLFFDQLKVLQPDLIIVSLGTNESYGKITPLEYLKQVQEFLLKVRTQNPQADVLVVTPPPSYLPHHTLNTFVDEYAKSLVSYATLGNYAVWDLFQTLGGMHGVSKIYGKGLMSPDRVHYTTNGYQLQGNMLYNVLLNAFNEFNK
ncbi:LysM peptidoglycan-binding domain-containing protein [Flavobacterium sp. TSSA_36]|uniref:LysM peptidoglycan-binding domain-containing protein n=1 Tax=Flavobacterium sp. TSSA_36 TaxID=3447669 RepID=UPI003F3221B8